jgi:hypothetical protein
MPSPDLAAITDQAAGLLAEFETCASDDPVKRDLELIHVPCGQAVCDVEDGDRLEVLVLVAAGHAHSCPRTTRDDNVGQDPVRDFLRELAIEFNTRSGTEWDGADVVNWLTIRMEQYGVEKAGLSHDGR